MTDTLKLCPSCASTPHTGSGGYGPRYVACPNVECPVSPAAYGKTDEAAARLWNTRPTEDALVAALAALLRRDEGRTCLHEETRRGGVIWEICEGCGAKWADDEGGKPEWKDPPEWSAVRTLIAQHRGQG